MVAPPATSCAPALAPALRTLAAFLAGHFLGRWPERRAKAPVQPAGSEHLRRPLPGASRRRRAPPRAAGASCPRPPTPPVCPAPAAAANSTLELTDAVEVPWPILGLAAILPTAAVAGTALGRYRSWRVEQRTWEPLGAARERQ